MIGVQRCVVVSISRRGFTLIELLVVIAIIGMLSSVVLASLNTARAKARDAARAAEIKSLKLALELYYDSNNTYPQLGTSGGGADAASLASLLVPTYIPKIPSDPQGNYTGYVWGPTSAYGLYVYTEASGRCVTGMSVNPGWWGNPPACKF